MKKRSKPSSSIRPEVVPLDEDAQPPLPFSTTLVLVAANLIPLLGVLFGGWKLGEVVGLYWAESVVIGCYTLLKIAFVAKEGAIFFGMIFVWSFGLFTAFQFEFIYDLFVRGADARGPAPGTLEALASLFLPIWPALLALFLVHGVSFVQNFIARREYEGATIDRLVTVPHLRMILMQATIFFGAWMVILLHSPMPALVLLVVLKVALDLKLMDAGSKSKTESASD